MQIVHCDVQAFNEVYDVRFEDIRLMSIEEIMISSKCFAASYRVIHILYTTVCKTMVKQQAVLSPIAKLSKDASAAKTVEVMRLDD